MYNINQLNQMSEEQLRELAKSMGLKHVDSYTQDALVFEILDHQAETEAANTPEPVKRRRERIARQPAAKANGNEVTKDDAVATKNKKNQQDTVVETPKQAETPQEPAAVAEEQPAAIAAPKRKRGRPSAAEKAAREAALAETQETVTEENKTQQEQQEPAETTKRRGRGRSKTKQTVEEPVLPFDNMDAEVEQTEVALTSRDAETFRGPSLTICGSVVRGLHRGARCLFVCCSGCGSPLCC